MPYKDPNKQREYQRRWIAERRRQWFEGKSCVWCGSTQQLEIDHIDRFQKVSHAIWSWSQSRRDQELLKCHVLCRPCHVIKSQIVGDLGSGGRVIPGAVVDEVRRLYATGRMTQQQLADQIGTNQQYISDIISMKKRKHV